MNQPPIGATQRHVIAAILFVALAAGTAAAWFASRNGKEPATPAEPPREVVQQPASPTSEEPRAKEPSGKLVTAAWYPVPENSIARRRALGEELTAAHNSLPLGTRLRLTHPQTGKSVTVRVTDRGIRDRRVKIDICKQAAEELDMIETGMAKLRMQILPEESEPGAAVAAPVPTSPAP